MPPLEEDGTPNKQTNKQAITTAASAAAASTKQQALDPQPLTSAASSSSDLTTLASFSPPSADAVAAAGFLLSSSSSSSPIIATTNWRLSPSLKATRTSNPVRNIVDNLRPPPPSSLLAQQQPLLNFSLGDPTAFSTSHLSCPDLLLETLLANAKAGTHNGYTNSAGSLEARAALARAFSYTHTQTLTPEDVIIASGGSGALELVLTALLNEGDAVLVPCPGFALYEVIAKSLGAEALPYYLQESNNWAIDIGQLEASITPTTKAILINNPSNPCGNVLAKENLCALLEVAERHGLPIVSDEIYGRLVFPGSEFWPLGSLTRSVPVLTVGGLAKQFVVPGWRVGWVLMYDPLGVMKVCGGRKEEEEEREGERGKEEEEEGLVVEEGEGLTTTTVQAQTQTEAHLATVPPPPLTSTSSTTTTTTTTTTAKCSLYQGLKNLTQLILGANTLAQSVIPALFPPTPSPHLELYYNTYLNILHENARFVQATLEGKANSINNKIEGGGKNEQGGGGGKIIGVSSPHTPQGAMYMLLKLDPTAFTDLSDDVTFCARLLEEENMVLLPGQCFHLKGYVRLVLAPPREMLAEGLERMRGFCARHAHAGVGGL